MTETPFRCLLCQHDQARPVLEGCRDVYVGFEGEWDYLECEACRLVQIGAVPENLGDFYKDYPVHAKKSAVYELFRRRFMSKGYYFPAEGLSGKSVIDFGCGDAWYLDEARRQGARVLGFEPLPALAEALRARIGAPVVSSIDAMRAELPEGADIVTLHWVFEHVPNLAETFQLALDLLKPGGRLYLLVPDIRSREARRFGRSWNGLDAPRHLSFPEPEHIERLCAEAGAQLLSSRRFGMPSTLSASLATKALGRFSALAFLALMTVAIPWSAWGDGHLGLVIEKPR